MVSTIQGFAAIVNIMMLMNITMISTATDSGMFLALDKILNPHPHPRLICKMEMQMYHFKLCLVIVSIIQVFAAAAMMMLMNVAIIRIAIDLDKLISCCFGLGPQLTPVCIFSSGK